MVFRIAPIARVFVLAVTLAGSAYADDMQRSAAQALFDDARVLMAEKRFAEACPKLAESHRLDPASGTLLNLAVCHERDGKAASAWLAYTETLAMAAKEGNAERKRLARERIDALEGELSRLRLILPKRVPEKFWVRLDGVELGSAASHTGFPVDPGNHRVTSGAPGMKTALQTIDVTTPGATLDLRLPELEHDKKPGPPGARASHPNRRRSDDVRLLLTGASFGVGAAGIVVGAYTGLRAGIAWDERNAECASGCSERAVEAGDDANALAVASNIAFAAGVAALGVGTYLVLTAPRSSPSREVRVGARVGASAAELAIGGSF